MGNSIFKHEPCNWDKTRILSIIVGILAGLLVLSLCWNIYCCVLRCRSGTAIRQSKKQQRRSSRQMEENPIYGNVTYTSMTLIAESESPRSRAQPGLDNNSSMDNIKGTPQECYANLTLKAPRVQSGHNSPKIQYSDIIQVQDLPESEGEDKGCTEVASIVSDLYASVQTHRVKTIDSAEEGEGYANHL